MFQDQFSYANLQSLHGLKTRGDPMTVTPVDKTALAFRWPRAGLGRNRSSDTQTTSQRGQRPEIEQLLPRPGDASRGLVAPGCRDVPRGDVPARRVGGEGREH